MTSYDEVTRALIERLRHHGRPCYVIVPELQRALELHDQGISVMLGEVDDVATYRHARASEAALVAATADDYANTNVTFAVREQTAAVPIVAFARASDSVDVIELAGASSVIQLTDMLGRSLARRTLGGDARANVIGRFGDLLIAEAPVLGTPLVGRTIAKSGLRDATGLTVVGLWARGEFVLPAADRLIEATTVLVLAGSESQLDALTELMAIYSPPDAPVLILAAAVWAGRRRTRWRSARSPTASWRGPAARARPRALRARLRHGPGRARARRHPRRPEHHRHHQ